MSTVPYQITTYFTSFSKCKLFYKQIITYFTSFSKCKLFYKQIIMYFTSFSKCKLFYIQIMTYFNFHITNFPFLSSNIPSSPAYGVFISQLIRYARACSSYECFILRARRLSSKLLKQGYLVEHLKSSFRKFYGRYGDLIEQYGVTLSRMLNDILTLDQQWLPYRSDFSTNFMTFIPSLTSTELWVVSMEHLQRVWLASRERLPFRTPGSVPHFGTC